MGLDRPIVDNNAGIEESDRNWAGSFPDEHWNSFSFIFEFINIFMVFRKMVEDFSRLFSRSNETKCSKGVTNSC